MDEKHILHLLSALQIDTRKRSLTGSSASARWLTVSCPFAPFTHAKSRDDNPSFGITVNEGGPSYYKCLACQKKGRLAGLPTLLAGYRKKDYRKLRLWAEEVELEIKVARPVPDWEDSDPLQSIAEDKRQETRAKGSVGAYPLALGSRYLFSRGMTALDIMRLNVRYDVWQKRVLFPVYGSDDTFAGFTGRKALDRKKWPKRDPKVRDYFGLDKRKLFLGLKGEQPGRSIITEGLFDYSRMVSLGFPNAKAILGTAMTREKIDMLIDRGDPQYFFMDNDQAGWQALFGIPDGDGGYKQDQSWAHNLYTEITVWVVPWPNVFDGRDPASITSRKDVDKHLKRAWMYTGKIPLDEQLKPAWFT